MTRTHRAADLSSIECESASECLCLWVWGERVFACERPSPDFLLHWSCCHSYSTVYLHTLPRRKFHSCSVPAKRRLHARERHSHLRMSLSALVVVALAASTGSLQVGDPAPDFTATSHTGATVSLKDYAGRKVILWFYPRASTGG